MNEVASISCDSSRRLDPSRIAPRMRPSRKFAFVVPRFGKGVLGGNETLVGLLAEHLLRRGDEVEILTTCARDNRTWINEFSAGEELVGSTPVHRFPVDERNLDEWIPLQIRVSEGMRLTVDEQFKWFSQSVNSTKLYEYIAGQGHRYTGMFFTPYLFGTTFWGSLLHPKRSALIPCLHDEHFAYVPAVRSMFRLVGRALFNCAPEQDLAHRLYGPVAGGEVGIGFTPLNPDYVRGLAPFFDTKFPYLLCLGRKETGKRTQILIDTFIEAKERNPLLRDLRLVIAGGGSFSDLHRPDALARDDIIDVPPLTEEEKRRLIRHATALVQPSRNESFSIVLMEAWQLDVPVLVDSRAEVTRYHVEQSGGGLHYSSTAEFSKSVELFLLEPSTAAVLGSAGRQYVESHYSWETVLDRFDEVVSRFWPLDQPA